MRGIDVFYQLCYFLSLNARNAYIQGLLFLEFEC
jgi:hypothetical protein